MTISAVILAGGKSSRTQTSTPKFFLPLADKPLLQHIIDTYSSLTSDIYVVTSPSHISAPLPQSVTPILQPEPNGTAGALLAALPHLHSEQVIVQYADMPLIQPEDVLSLKDESGVATVLAARLPVDLAESPYGRVIFNSQNEFERICEFKELNNAKLYPFFNTGLYKFSVAALRKYLPSVKPHGKELFLPDVLEIMKAHGENVEVVKKNDFQSFLGVNTLAELAQAEHIVQTRLRSQFLSNGVLLQAPDSTIFSADTQIGKDCIIENNVVFRGTVILHDNVTIKAFSYIEDAEIMDGAIVGPFAHLRGGSTLHRGAEVGNFVEVKKSNIGEKTKIKHLSYIGDAEIGNKTNIGAGSIVCNYDGVKKYKTTIGTHVFVGSNSALIAPIAIGDNSLVAAGSTLTDDVAADELAVARARQVNIPEGAKKIWLKKGKSVP